MPIVQKIFRIDATIACVEPPSTARTAGRSDWAERRLRRQPFILLLVGASSISLVSAESGENSLIPLRLLFPPNPLRWASAGALFSSTNRSIRLRYAEGAPHTARGKPFPKRFQITLAQTANVRFRTRKRVHTRLRQQDRTQRLTGRNRDVSAKSAESLRNGDAHGARLRSEAPQPRGAALSPPVLVLHRRASERCNRCDEGQREKFVNVTVVILFVVRVVAAV